MANFQGTARTNYFRVKDEQAFRDLIDLLPDQHLMTEVGKDDITRFGFYSDNPDDGCFPNRITFDDNLTREDQLPAPFLLPDVLDDIDYYEQEDENGQVVKTIMDITIDLPRLVSHYLAEGEVAVFMQAGAENVRYVSGWATAVNHLGRQVHIVLDDIYAKAAVAFHMDSSAITKASY